MRPNAAQLAAISYTAFADCLSALAFWKNSALRFIGLSVYRFLGLSVYRFIGLSVYRFIGLSVYRFIGLSVLKRVRIIIKFFPCFFADLSTSYAHAQLLFMRLCFPVFGIWMLLLCP